MSLRNFHVFFIMVSTITCFGFGLWCFFSQSASGVAGSSVMGVVSLIAAAGLVVYGIRFVKKLDREGIE